MIDRNPYIIGALAAPLIIAAGAGAVAASLWAAHEVQEAWLRGRPRFMRDHGNRVEMAAAIATCKAVIGFRVPGIPGVALLTIGRPESTEGLRAKWMIEQALKEARA